MDAIGIVLAMLAAVVVTDPESKHLDARRMEERNVRIAPMSSMTASVKSNRRADGGTRLASKVNARVANAYLSPSVPPTPYELRALQRRGRSGRRKHPARSGDDWHTLRHARSKAHHRAARGESRGRPAERRSSSDRRLPGSAVKQPSGGRRGRARWSRAQSDS